MPNFDLYGGSKFKGVGRRKESQVDISNSDLMYRDISEIITFEVEFYFPENSM